MSGWMRSPGDDEDRTPPELRPGSNCGGSSRRSSSGRTRHIPGNLPGHGVSNRHFNFSLPSNYRIWAGIYYTYLHQRNVAQLLILHICFVRFAEKADFLYSLQAVIISMTSLLSHTVAHSTRPSLRPKTNYQPLKKFLSLAVSWVKVVKNCKILTFKVNFLRQNLSESF